MKTQIWCCFATGLLLLSGCGGAETSITGRVSLDGKPVPEGSIRFIPMEGTQGADAGAVIRDGKYKVVVKDLASGKYRVSIRGYKHGGKMEPDPLGGSPIKGTVQIVPPQYQGEDSTLVEEISLGVNRLDFPLVTSEAGT